MARVFYTAAYKGVRALNWVIGVVLLVFTLLMSFTGYLLPWDQLAFWAATIAANIAASWSGITDALNVTQYFDPGTFVRTLFVGSRDIGQEALIRFYLLHCIVLPLGLVSTLGVHMWRIRKNGGLARPVNLTEEDLKGTPTEHLSENILEDISLKTDPIESNAKETSPVVEPGLEHTVPSWTHLVPRIVTLFMLTFAAVCICAFFIDAPLKEMANPAVPENPAKAPWYFLGLQELVSYSTFMGGVGIPLLTILGLAVIPYLDLQGQEVGRWFDNDTGKRVALNSLALCNLSLLLSIPVPSLLGYSYSGLCIVWGGIDPLVWQR
jgi:quinol-cytochrome oxidoreductase complex cytochrome b subunit